MKKGFLLSLLVVASMDIFGAHSGHVYLDKNKNGKFDPGEKTLSGVMVSDGLNVVKTTRDGSFTLPGHAREKFIFITTPSGYKTDNAYYRKIESGSSAYDFGVQPYSGQIGKDGAHRFIHISDTEIHNSPMAEQGDWVQNLRDYTANEGAAFIIHTGDICYDDGLKNHIELMNTANMNTQMFYCIGNHDLVKGAYGEELFEQLYGPVFYSFNVGKVHYIVTPMLGGDYRSSYTKADVYRWLKNDLAQLPEGTPIVVFNHDLLTTGDSFVYGLDDNEFIDLDAHHLKAWIYGHWHVNHIHKHKQAYSICTSTLIRGGIDHSTSAFRVMKIDSKGDFTSELRYTYLDKSVRIASIDNLQAPVSVAGKVPLSVNAYSTTTPVDRITYRCLVEGKEVASGRLSEQQTDFNWSGEISLPAQLAGELITVSVEARFNNGETARAEQSFVYRPGVSSPIALTGDWCNLLGNPQHAGVSADALSTPLQLVWTRNIGANIFMTSPVVYRDAVFAASMDENNEGKAAVVSLDARTGAIRWKYAVRSSVKNSIAASDGLILAQDVEGYLYALDAATGRLAWEKKLRINKTLPTLIEGLVVADGIVYAGSGTGLCAVGVKDGKELWVNKTWGQNQGSTATLALHKNVLIGSSHWGELLANNAATGALLWRASKDGIRHRSSSAVMHNSVLYLTSDHSLFVMDAETGTVLVRKELPYSVDVASSPLVTDAEIIFGTGADGVVALDRETLAEKWRYRTGAAMIYTSPYVRNPSAVVEASPVASGDAIFVGGSDGVLYALDRAKGVLLWKHTFGAPVLGSVAISGNALFAVDFGGNVYGFASQADNRVEEAPVQNTLKVEPGDSPATIIGKAARVVPTPNQLQALQNEFIAFIHFGPNTFTRMEWGNGKEDPKLFDLKELDTDQWCQAIKAAGMKMVMLTVKHHDGFVLWQSRYTKHGIMSTGFRNGKGDVLKDLSASCRKYGLKLGVYLSPADLFQIESPDGLYGNLSQYTKRTIPRPVPGRPFKNTTTFEFEVDDYNEYFLNQLFEILTEYGPVHEVWFDGAHPKTKGGQKYNYAAWKKLIRTLAPEAVVFGREDIRWCGNESGNTRSTEWNVIPFAENPDTTANFPDLTVNDLGSREKLYKGTYLHYQQAETNTSIREGWFYRDDSLQKVRSADDVFDIYERSVGGNSTFLLNIPPNRNGKFSQADADVLKETGKRISETYGTDLLRKAKGPKELLDGDPDTYFTVESSNPEVVITAARPVTINRLLIQEAIATHGERVEAHAVDAWIDGAWKEIAQASNIGYKRILRFPEVTTDRLRVRILQSRATPAISCLSAHYYKSRPPQLSFKRDIDGRVTIEPSQQAFNWKAHGEDIAGNLNAGFKIYYTTDGTEPDAAAKEYTGPFSMDNGELKAVAILNRQKGTVNHQRFGFIKRGWKLLEAGSQNQKHPAALVFDADPQTYWMSQQGAAPHFIAIDLGKTQTLSGLAYTPQQQHAQGMMAKGSVKTSLDGKSWQEAERFEFGNLINDPTQRYHYFSTPLTARYIRIEATEIAAKGESVAIAEIDLF